MVKEVAGAAQLTKQHKKALKVAVLTKP